MHLLFFVHSKVPTLPPPPPPSHPPTLLLNRHAALGVTAGITCRASGALHFANGLISCQGHPISPEIDSLSLLSSLSRFCRDSPHECCDDGAQRKSRPVSHGRVWKTCAQPVLFIDAFFSPLFLCLSLEVWRLLMDVSPLKTHFFVTLQSVVCLHEKFRSRHEKYDVSAEWWIWIEMLYICTFIIMLRLGVFCFYWWNFSDGSYIGHRTQPTSGRASDQASDCPRKWQNLETLKGLNWLQNIWNQPYRHRIF